MKKLSKRKKKDQTENHYLLKAKMEEKAKQVTDSNEIIQEEEVKILQKKKNTKIEQLRLFNLKKEKVMESMEKIKEMDNKKWTEQRSNLDCIEKNNDLKKEQIFEKHQKIEGRIKDVQQRRINEFISKRQEKLMRIRENSEEINETVDRRNGNLMNKYHGHLKNISKKNKSMKTKKQNIK